MTRRSEAASATELRLATELRALGHRIGCTVLAELFKALQFAGEPQTLKGTHHPDRDAQFTFLNAALPFSKRRLNC